MSKNLKEAKYHTIALEISKRITARELKVGDKLRGRSLLSSQYNVSSETIRKAIVLLSNQGVVEVKERSGIYVLSETAALEYIKMNYKNEQDKRLYQEIELLFTQQKSLQNELYNKFKDYLRVSVHPNHFPFEYFYINIQNPCPYIGYTLEDIPLWQNTEGTIIAIQQNGRLIPSPNPNTILQENDVLYILGNENVYKKALTFLQL